MFKPLRVIRITTIALGVIAAAQANAHDINSPVDSSKSPSFDITKASGTTDGRLMTFTMEVAGAAGSKTPKPVGQLKGAQADAYVWPTSLDPATVGFDTKSGILALAITSHPDFDDTPLFDENNDGDPENDGKTWHSHWVVLVKEAKCGAGLTVRDVSPGQDLLPATAPGLPIALDSPGMSPRMSKRVAKITVPVDVSSEVMFDAVTATLEVNPTGGKPLLCVSGVTDIASGDLSLPGRVMKK